MQHYSKARMALTGGAEYAKKAFMTLHEWMTANGLTDAEMARKLGVSQASTVSRYRRFERVPEPMFMKRIEEITKRQVTASDFIEGDVAKAERRINAA
jgi:transcriptional regulator with XRE-family HTH domain